MDVGASCIVWTATSVVVVCDGVSTSVKYSAPGSASPADTVAAPVSTIGPVLVSVLSGLIAFVASGVPISTDGGLPSSGESTLGCSLGLWCSASACPTSAGGECVPFLATGGEVTLGWLLVCCGGRASACSTTACRVPCGPRTLFRTTGILGALGFIMNGPVALGVGSLLGTVMRSLTAHPVLACRSGKCSSSTTRLELFT